jgi:hypothetical protein
MPIAQRKQGVELIKPSFSMNYKFNDVSLSI